MSDFMVPPNPRGEAAFRILPAGWFSASDGRKDGTWYLSADQGRFIASLAAQRAQDFLIDYEHQSLITPPVEFPAAGWFKKLEWRNDGLYVLDARWTDRAKQMILSSEYRFVSPVFKYDPSSKAVLSLDGLSLTNNPALLGLADLSKVAVATAQTQIPEQDSHLADRSREAYIRVFGGTPEELLKQQAMKDQTPLAPPGTTDEEWAKLIHVFGKDVFAK